MYKKTFIIVGVLITIAFSQCKTKTKEQPGVRGVMEDEYGNPVDSVSLSFKGSSTSVETDTAGMYHIAFPQTLFVKFEKEGYQPFRTRIINFSDDASYDLRTVNLRKIDAEGIDAEDTVFDSNPKLTKFKGHVYDIFERPLENIQVTIIDSLITFPHSTLSSYNLDKGHFHFRKYTTLLSFEKEGFQKVIIELPVYNKANRSITLLPNSNKKGVYLIKSGKYIKLPQTNLVHKSEKKYGHVLWGGRFGYNVTDFFYPDNLEEFKIEKDTKLRFVIFEPGYGSGLYAANNDRYLCTANYKYTTSPFPKTKSVKVETIYPPEYNRGYIRDIKLVEFTGDTAGVNYVFVNSKSKKGYYFTY